MKLSFSVDLHDNEGDVFEECILLYVGESTIIKFKTYAETVAFSDSVKGMLHEIKENLPIERLSKELATTASTNKPSTICLLCGHMEVCYFYKHSCGGCNGMFVPRTSHAD